MNKFKIASRGAGVIFDQQWWKPLLVLAALGLAGAAQGDQGTPGVRGSMNAPTPALAPLILAQAATAAARNAQADLDALVKAAKAEGEVTYYANFTENVGKRVSTKFREKYGINAVYVRFPGDGGIQRFATEAESGTFAADILLNFGSGTFAFSAEGLKKGWLEPVNTAGLPVLTSGEFPTRLLRGPLALVHVAPWLIVYHTEKLKGADIPKDWPDLLNPKYKGQVLVYDPRCCSVAVEFWKVIMDKYGESFLSQIAAQTGRQYASGVPAVQGLAAGEGVVFLPFIMPAVQGLKEKGAPIDVVSPGYTTGLEMNVVLTARGKAKHPNAARLMANYVMSQEGNKVLNDDPGGFSMYESARLPSQYVSPDAAALKSTDRIANLLGFK